MKATTQALSLIIAIRGAFATPTPAMPDELDSRQAAPVQCETCDPLPDGNQCHPSTSCISTWGGHNDTSTPYPYYCACRAGYKGTYAGADPTAQWRLPWETQEGRVYVRPSVECNTLCDDWSLGLEGCGEVFLYPQCL